MCFSLVLRLAHTGVGKEPPKSLGMRLLMFKTLNSSNKRRKVSSKFKAFSDSQEWFKTMVATSLLPHTEYCSYVSKHTAF